MDSSYLEHNFRRLRRAEKCYNRFHCFIEAISPFAIHSNFATIHEKWEPPSKHLLIKEGECILKTPWKLRVSKLLQDHFCWSIGDVFPESPKWLPKIIFFTKNYMPNFLNSKIICENIICQAWALKLTMVGGWGVPKGPKCEKWHGSGPKCETSPMM